MENTNKNYMIFGLILGLSLIVSASIGSFTFYKLRSMDYISTTGSAKKPVVSDKVKWATSITRQAKASTIKDGYVKLDADLKVVKDFLSTNGITDDSITVSPVLMNEIWDNNNAQAEKNYNLVQNIEIQSNDVQKIDNLSKNIGPVMDKGVLFATTSLEFYYSKLPDIRIELLDNAIADAKLRADKIAKAGGKQIGALQSASSGVVQVLAPNSVEVSDYGMYDTSKINKEIMVSVKTSFEIK